jgi:hypothetical protein
MVVVGDWLVAITTAKRQRQRRCGRWWRLRAATRRWVAERRRSRTAVAIAGGNATVGGDDDGDCAHGRGYRAQDDSGDLQCAREAVGMSPPTTKAAVHRHSDSAPAPIIATTASIESQDITLAQDVQQVEPLSAKMYECAWQPCEHPDHEYE